MIASKGRAEVRVSNYYPSEWQCLWLGVCECAPAIAVTSTRTSLKGVKHCIWQWLPADTRVVVHHRCRRHLGRLFPNDLRSRGDQAHGWSTRRSELMIACNGHGNPSAPNHDHSRQ
eukprot:4037494-Amphidinium_carterae.1